jgi:hypothetical protein
MPFIKDTTRKLRNASEINKINHILEQYVDFNNLFIQSDFKTIPVKYIDHPEEDTLRLLFNKPLEEDHVRMYSVVHDRFIEFHLETIAPSGKGHPDLAYDMKILNCLIATDKREHERFQFSEKKPLVKEISTIKVAEREGDFRKSLLIKLIVEEFINKLNGIDFKKVYFRDDKNPPPTVKYVIESGNMLHLKNTSDVAEFFNINEKFFNETKVSTLKEDLLRWAQTNASSVRSILVKPVPYHPLVGNEFIVGFLSVMNREKTIDAPEMEHLDAFINELSVQIRNGNLIETKAEGIIHDVSAGGGKIELSDPKLVDKIMAQNIIVFEMNFREKTPIMTSGKIVYLYKNDDGGYYIGVNFKGSQFGPQLTKVLPIHVKHFLYDKKG